MVVSLHVVVGNWILTSACSCQPTPLIQSLLALAQRFIIIHKFTVADFWHTRRGRQISLWVVVSHHVVAGIWTQDLWKGSQCSCPLSHLSSPWHVFFSILVYHCFCLSVSVSLYVYICVRFCVGMCVRVSMCVDGWTLDVFLNLCPLYWDKVSEPRAHFLGWS